MSSVEYRFKPQGKTLEAYMLDRSRISGIIGPLGSGKTIQTCQKIFKLMCEQQPDDDSVRRSRWYAIRNTYPDLFGTTIKDWRALFDPLGKFKQGGMEPPTHKLNFKLEDGTRVESEMIFLSMDSEEHVKKLRGSQATGFWLNEWKELLKSTLDMADLRHGRYPRNCSWHGIVADSNAPDNDHYLYNLAEESLPDGWKIFKQPGGVIRSGTKPDGKINWVVNPDAENIKNLPKDYYKNGMQGKDDDWIAVNLANEYGYVKTGKPVYQDYNDNVHCLSFEFNESVPIYRGWDFGHPACVLAQFTPKGRLIVRREWTSDITMGIDRFSDIVLSDCADLHGFEFIDVGDPSGEASSKEIDEMSCFQVLRNKGLDIQPGQQDPKVRRNSVMHFLGRMIEGLPAFMLHPDCKVLRKGFQGAYCYDRVKVSGERYHDKPNKGATSHPHDALQYICTYIVNVPEDDDDYDDLYNDKGRSKVGGY